MNKILITIIITTCSLFLSAQEDIKNTQDKTQHKLGLFASTIRAVGFSYKLVLQEKYQFQIVALPVASKNQKILLSGLAYRYKFKSFKNWDILSFVSAGYYYNKTSYDDDSAIINDDLSDPINDDLSDPSEEVLSFSTGLAFEYGKSDFLKLNLQVGYGLYNVTSEDWSTNLSTAIGFDFLINRIKK